MWRGIQFPASGEIGQRQVLSEAYRFDIIPDYTPDILVIIRSEVIMWTDSLLIRGEVIISIQEESTVLPVSNPVVHNRFHLPTSGQRL